MTSAELRRLVARAVAVRLPRGFARDLVLRALHGVTPEQRLLEEPADRPPGTPKSLWLAGAAVAVVGVVAATGAGGPAPPSVERFALSPSTAIGPPISEGERRLMEQAVRGLRASDAEERRAAAEFVHRVSLEREPARRLALAEALSDLPGDAARLPLLWLTGDSEPAVRMRARRALLDRWP